MTQTSQGRVSFPIAKRERLEWLLDEAVSRADAKLALVKVWGWICFWRNHDLAISAAQDDLTEWQILRQTMRIDQ